MHNHWRRIEVDDYFRSCKNCRHIGSRYAITTVYECDNPEADEDRVHKYYSCPLFQENKDDTLQRLIKGMKGDRKADFHKNKTSL